MAAVGRSVYGVCVSEGVVARVRPRGREFGCCGALLGFGVALGHVVVVVRGIVEGCAVADEREQCVCLWILC